MGEVVDIATLRERAEARKEARALRRAQQVALAAFNELSQADLSALADYVKPQWPGGIDDLDV